MKIEKEINVVIGKDQMQKKYMKMRDCLKEGLS